MTAQTMLLMLDQKLANLAVGGWLGAVACVAVAIATWRVG